MRCKEESRSATSESRARAPTQRGPLARRRADLRASRRSNGETAQQRARGLGQARRDGERCGLGSAHRPRRGPAARDGVERCVEQLLRACVSRRLTDVPRETAITSRVHASPRGVRRASFRHRTTESPPTSADGIRRARDGSDAAAQVVLNSCVASGDRDGGSVRRSNPPRHAERFRAGRPLLLTGVEDRRCAIE
jgi:hypothetical protein